MDHGQTRGRFMLAIAVDVGRLAVTIVPKLAAKSEGATEAIFTANVPIVLLVVGSDVINKRVAVARIDDCVSALFHENAKNVPGLGFGDRAMRHAATAMLSAEFKSSVVSRADGQLVLAFFDGKPLTILRCSEAAGSSLRRALEQALSQRSVRDDE